MAYQQEIGEGRAWAVATANQIAHMRFDDAVAACQQQAVAAMELRQDPAVFPLRKDVGAWNRYGRTIHNLCNGWLGMGQDAIPAPHEDLDLLIGSNRVFGNRAAVNYDPSAPYPSSVTNRLRVVRLALPEVLRELERPSVAVSSGLKVISSTLEPIAGKGPNRPKKWPSMSRWL